MFDLWKGVFVTAVIQAVTGFIVYEWTMSSKATAVAMVAVSAMSGLVVWGFLEGDDVGWPLSHALAVAVLVVFADVFFSNASYWWVWGPAAKWGTLLLFACSWFVPAAIHKMRGETTSAFVLCLVATPMCIGALFGAVILAWKTVTTGKIRIRGKYRRVFG